ncbi:S-layer homology domain-containing protein [Cohnella sp. GCM10012308]|uniref:S-layer homology domain-containing protein n=1 Tax=Cohnella sp. GCM10012308 TaxID=3317329 RepID=UPI00361973CB
MSSAMDQEQIYLRFADGTTATSAGQKGQSTITIANPNHKQIVGAYVTDGTVSWVGDYSYSGFDVNVSSIAGRKPAFAATSVRMDPLPAAADEDGYYSVQLAVYGVNDSGVEQPVTGKTEVFMEASGTSFKDTVDSSSTDADGGFSNYTTNGQVEFLIKPQEGVSIDDLIYRIWSGPKLLYSDDPADLSSLELFGATLAKAFQPDVVSYVAKAPNDTANLSVAAAAYTPGTALTVMGEPASSGMPSRAIPLNVGWNEIAVTVALADQTSKTYAISVLRHGKTQGLGTEQQPYLIKEVDQLDQIRDHLDDPNVYFKLAADVDMGEFTRQADWDPIGTAALPFRGHLDGAGYTISNLTFDINEYTGGLFGYLGREARIHDLKLSDVSMASSTYVGGIAGESEGTITDSTVTGSVRGFESVGGLVGNNQQDAVIEGSSFSGDVRSEYRAGGLIGYNDGQLRRSHAEANIESISINGEAGGLAGVNNSGSIMNSYAIGKVSGWRSGGIAGTNTSEIGYSYAASSLTTGSIGGTGGIGGMAGGTIEKSFFDADIAGISDAESGLTTEQMKSAATYAEAGWDLDEIWAIDPDVNDGYPTLRQATSLVTYDGNGSTAGTVPVDSNSYTSGSLATAADNSGELTKEGYLFKGWNTEANGIGTDVAPGAQVKVGASGLTLYAVWKLEQKPELRAATAGDASVALEWSGVQHATGYEVYRSTVSGQYGEPVQSVSGTVYGYTDTGLANGTTYYYAVKATSEGGDSELSNERSAKPAAAAIGGDDTPQSPSNPPSVTEGTSQIELSVNGKVIRGLTAKTKMVGGRKVTTLTIDASGAKALLDAAEQGGVVAVPVAEPADVVILQLSSSLLKGLEEKQLTLKLETPGASYSLPAQQIDLDGLRKQLGAESADDVKLEIEIATASSGVAGTAEQAAAQGGFTLVAPPVEFTVRALLGDKAANVGQFNTYVKRTIAIPNGVDPSAITTAIVVEADGTVRQVPTKFVVVEGKNQAVIQSRTNSAYALIGKKVSFADVEGHWANTAVNEMGSRLIVSGDGQGAFHPNRDITRAEFAAIVVRGLGLKSESAGISFPDVAQNAWYRAAVGTAAQLGLINGFEDGTFRPSDKITREQAMALIAKAMSLTGLTAEGSASDALHPFGDASQVSAWARDGVAKSLQAGIVSGRSASQLAPQASMTRAEVAALVRKLLAQSGLI